MEYELIFASRTRQGVCVFVNCKLQHFYAYCLPHTKWLPGCMWVDVANLWPGWHYKFSINLPPVLLGSLP